VFRRNNWTAFAKTWRFANGRVVTIDVQGEDPIPAHGSRLAESWLFVAILVLGLSAGFIQSAFVGFTIDDQFERLTIEVNRDTVAKLWRGDPEPFAVLDAYPDRYYGVFHYAVTAGPRGVFATILEKLGVASGRDALIAAQRPATFLWFMYGLVAFERILALAGIGSRLRTLAVLATLLNPYLFGHATMNVKDIPFMSMWLIATWAMLAQFQGWNRGMLPGWRAGLLLGALVGALASIRISGLLFGIQLFIAWGLLVAASAPRTVLARPAASTGYVVAIAGAMTTVMWLASPVLWQDPLRIIDAVRYMQKHPWAGCTWTWGTCMPGQTLPAHYVPAWFAVKLPVWVIVGCAALLPLACLRQHRMRVLAGIALLASVAAIVALLVWRGANLYNEIRQVLFLVPLLFIGAVFSMSISERVASVVLYLTIAVSVVDHVRSAPFQYVWFNEVSRFVDVERNFELDYWLTSSRSLAAAIEANEAARPLCIYSSFPEAQLRPFMTSDRCMLGPENLQKILRPSLSLFESRRAEHFEASGCAEVASVESALAGRRPFKLTSVFYCP
jgi:hypothetical protein